MAFIKRLSGTSATLQIIILTVGAWLIVSLVDYGGAYWAESFPRFSLLRYLWMEGDFALLLRQPWRLLSYLLVHNSLWHLVVNMLLLYYFGSIFERLLGKKHLRLLYLLGGVVSGLFYPLAMEVMRLWGIRLLSLPLLGSSGAIFATMMAIATFAPRKKIAFLGQELAIALPIFLIILWGILSGSVANRGGVAVHFGGICTGLLYAFALRYNGLRFHYSPSDTTQGAVSYIPSYDRLKWSKKGTSSREESNKTNPEREKEIARIMDKIKHSGYSCLSEKEKRILFDHSQSHHGKKKA